MTGKQPRQGSSAAREHLRRATAALAALREDLATALGGSSTPPVRYGERLGELLGRRVEDVEGAVAVAMALAERTGVELREELRAQTEILTEQLESVGGMARAAARAAAKAHDPYAGEASFDEVHHRIDALTRELRSRSSEQPWRGLPAPYGDRLALTLGRRLESVEGSLAVASAQAERIADDVRTELVRALDELARRLEHVERYGQHADLEGLTAAWRTELRALEVRVGDELATIQSKQVGARDAEEIAATRLRALTERLEQIERDRDAIAAQLMRGAESWATERAALQERVGELAARIVTGPVPDASAGGERDGWPTPRAFDQLRIAVEGLRMRLAYHEKEVAEIVGGRGVDQRIDEMHHLLRRLENAEQSVREERDTVLEQLDRVAARMDHRLHQIEASSPGPEL